MCGACLLVLEFLGVKSLSGGPLPPRERPSTARARLLGTPWADVFNLELNSEDDVWWFESQKSDLWPYATGPLAMPPGTTYADVDAMTKLEPRRPPRRPRGGGAK
ncbi:MAG: hypothetical protein JWQ77_4049 [Jatrophihabitans sp.]|nr:hypothetical protein [Jatrophihabitans sp.]